MLTTSEVIYTARPRPRLAVGLTGHRLDRLGESRVDAVADAITKIMALIERESLPAGRDALRLVTALADGADSIGADCAKRRRWALEVVLPFPRDDYAEDFTLGSPRNAYTALLRDCGAVMELPGDRHTPESKAIAYERAGRVVLAQSDILIAVWDGKPARGRGGAPQIIGEAVLAAIPVIHIDPTGGHDPLLIWDGLDERDLGQQSLETAARGDLTALTTILRTVLEAPSDVESLHAIERLSRDQPRRPFTIAIAYPLLLAVMGVRRLRRSDFSGTGGLTASAAAIDCTCSSGHGFAARLKQCLGPRFASADSRATYTAQLFRSVYVTNFAFAAFAVVLSLLGLALPVRVKPLLIALELLTIGTILVQTRLGRRRDWHRSWLDNRALAERLRCLAISSQLGDLDLRAAHGRCAFWVDWYAQTTAREIGLPSVQVDAAYLACLRNDLLALIDGQIAYLRVDADRMHRLEHRLHRSGTWLFAFTAIACVGLLLFKIMAAMLVGLHAFAQPITIAVTIISAALPAIGAAIYGIRMQGDFAGIAERSHTLEIQLSALRTVIADDVTTFDTLAHRSRRVTDLLTADLASWLQTSHARPLSLPG